MAVVDSPGGLTSNGTAVAVSPAPSLRSVAAISNGNPEKRATTPVLKYAPRQWNVVGASQKGRYAKKAFSALRGGKGHRQICVEVYNVPSCFDTADDHGSVSIGCRDTEVCIVRILHPATYLNGKAAKVDKRRKKMERRLRKGNTSDSDTIYSDDSFEMDHEDADHDGELSVYTARTDEKSVSNEGWCTRHKFTLSLFEVTSLVNKTVFADVMVKKKGKTITENREIIFESATDADEFYEEVNRQKRIQLERDQAHMERALDGISLKDGEQGEQLDFLVDVVSGHDIPSSDVGKSSDPYVVMRFGSKKIHKTLNLRNKSNPIWTLRQQSLFIWSVNALDLFRSEDGLIVEVKDKDRFNANDKLGAFAISAKELYMWEGERKEFPLILNHRKKGTLSLRIRRATATDQKFVDAYTNEGRKMSNDYPDFFDVKGGRSTLRSLSTTYKKKDKDKTVYKIRPEPDPKRENETKWLTDDKIQEEAMKESQKWHEIGSGTMGKIFVEIIGCSNLPNLDIGGGLGNKSDAFVSLVYEDCIARTDIIDDCLSPRWMPWTQRAFIFHMRHTSSQLFLGVFDYDSGTVDDHDIVGRVAVSLSNLRPDTVYLLHYDIYPTAKYPPRVAKGVITLRLRMELANEQALLLSNLQAPPDVYFHVKKRKDLKVARKTIEGSVDMSVPNPDILCSYIEELLSYLTVYYYMEDAFQTLMLWEGHFRIKLPLRRVPVYLPLHSATAFLFGILLVEYPRLMPSFFFGALCWLLLATSGYRINSEDPWFHCKSFTHFFMALCFGKVTEPQTIKEFENRSESLESATKWNTRVEVAEKRARETALKFQTERKELERELKATPISHEGADERSILLSTKPFFFPVQKFLNTVCHGIRVTKNVSTWDECYLSFWLTLASFSLAALFYFVPCRFIVKWLLRMIVWTVLGPWTSLFFRKERSEQKKVVLKLKNTLNSFSQSLSLVKDLLKPRISREDTEKMTDMRKYMFGKYAHKISVWKSDRYRDTPTLTKSSATRYNPRSYTLGSLAMKEAGYHRTRVEGFNLVGEMIPKLKEVPLTEAPIGRPTRNSKLLAKESAGALYVGSDSYGAALTKIGSIVISAVAITWFGVPLISLIFNWVFHGRR